MTVAQRHQQFIFAADMSVRIDAAAAERLSRARKMAGYATAGNAVAYRGWSPTDYLEHEAGRRAITADDALRYAAGYRVSARWILIGE